MSFDLKIQGGDLALSSTGDLAIVENTEKLVQDVLKIVSTQIGANPFFPWYGSPITKSLVGRSYDTNFITGIASQQLRTTLERLQAMQKDQLRTNQVVTPREQIAAISDVRVERNITDPRFFKIVLTVLSKAFLEVQTELDITL
jgi:hypothetical protein